MVAPDVDLSFEPTRAAGLAFLRDFVPKTGKYAGMRNYDLPGHAGVSRLSPYIRYRLVTEEEVLRAVLGRYALSTADKFVQEVFWRTYWKGWLELRPSVWGQYRAGLDRALDRVATGERLRRDWEAACQGDTGIAPFDQWARELVDTGYLHNHARMWFASIWCFTLRLPWELGADFFLRHLLDGDAASNTLSWRWVAGIQTPGKVYVARASNIAKYTEGRFGTVTGLAQTPEPLKASPVPSPAPMPKDEDWDTTVPTGLLLTEDDLSPGWLLRKGLTPSTRAVLLGTSGRSPLSVSDRVADFTARAARTTLESLENAGGMPGPMTEDQSVVLDWAVSARLRQIIVPRVPVGPAADRLARLAPLLKDAGIALRQPLRPFDAAAWPHATHGFFRFKAQIPGLLVDLGLCQADGQHG